MKILVTGSAGFIGFHTAIHLARKGHAVVGLDNLNHYYDVELKYARGRESGFHPEEMESGRMITSNKYDSYNFIKADLADREAMHSLFKNENFDIVCNLAAQAGVRYSIDNPHAYIHSNVEGFLNILEACRRFPVKHLLYASSSSVYGQNIKTPFNEEDKSDTPVSLYAATKKSGELMAYAYSKLYSIPATGLRFFTVYGPWGRPDMAPIMFLRSILNGEPIRVFNKGLLYRDFTYIDDVVKAISSIVESPPPSILSIYDHNKKSISKETEDSANAQAPHKIYNIGNSSPVLLTDFIKAIETTTGRKAVIKMEEMQPGDVFRTFADTTALERDYGYKPKTDIQKGIDRLYEWFSANELFKK
jgi:UDP-glucuronate 4-epimerase